MHGIVTLFIVHTEAWLFQMSESCDVRAISLVDSLRICTCSYVTKHFVQIKQNGESWILIRLRLVAYICTRCDVIRFEPFPLPERERESQAHLFPNGSLGPYAYIANR